MSRRTRVGLTRQGFALLVLTVLVALAASNTGANLLYLVLGLLTSTLLVALFAGRRVLPGLEVRLALPPLVEAGGSIDGVLELASARADLAHSVRVGGGPCLPSSGIYVESLGPGGRSEVPFRAVAPERGVVDGVTIELSTRSPFHLVSRRRTVAAPARVAVYPRLRPPRQVTAQGYATGAKEAPLPGQGGSLRDLRPYVVGDNPRLIHWRASARAGETLVRELHAEVHPELRVVVDTSGPPGERFESLLADAASAVRDALRSELAVDLELGHERLRLAGAGDLTRALACFARAEPVAARPAAVQRPVAGPRELRFPAPRRDAAARRVG